MMTMGRVKGKRIMMTLQERLQKMSMMVRRRMMRMMPSSLTLTPYLPSIGLRASRLNKTNRSPP